MAAVPDKILDGRYRLGAVFGRGNFGKVRLGTDIKTGHQYAVKEIERRQTNPSLIKREIVVLRQLNHPLIARLYEVLQTDSKIYLVMELCSGGELMDRLKKSGRFDEATARRYFGQIASALHYTHSLGISHRDLKPENILLGGEDNDTIKIIDFGFSVMKSEGGLLHTFCGTPHYVAPEILQEAPHQLKLAAAPKQCSHPACVQPALGDLPPSRNELCASHSGKGTCGKADCPYDIGGGTGPRHDSQTLCAYHACPIHGCDGVKSSRAAACPEHLREQSASDIHRSTCDHGYNGSAADCWALGIILYYMLAGHPPFEAPDLPSMIRTINAGSYDLPAEIFNDEVRNLLEGLLAVDPKKRFTAADVLAHPWSRLRTGGDAEVSIPTVASPSTVASTSSAAPSRAPDRRPDSAGASSSALGRAAPLSSDRVLLHVAAGIDGLDAASAHMKRLGFGLRPQPEIRRVTATKFLPTGQVTVVIDADEAVLTVRAGVTL